jgi:hypothetical protein
VVTPARASWCAVTMPALLERDEVEWQIVSVSRDGTRALVKLKPTEQTLEKYPKWDSQFSYIKEMVNA